jgi:tetraacyldisaccharide 4'-kinase
MLPTVTDLTLQRLKRRLWSHWFGPSAPSPFRPPPSVDDAPALLKRGLKRRLLRARWTSTVIWLLALPFLFALSKLTSSQARRRQSLQQKARRAPQGCSIAVGNLLVGGTGKTPLVISLAKTLTQSGHKVAVLSRGYKRATPKVSSPRTLIIGPDCRDPGTGELLHPDSTGDEPWLIALRAQVPVAVGQDRHFAAQQLSQHFPEISLWLLDDGLSQTSLCPDIRMLVLDERGMGNGHCLPYGPLRMEWTRQLAYAWSRPIHPSENPSEERPLVLAHPKEQSFEQLFEQKGLPSPYRLATKRSASCWIHLNVRGNSEPAPTQGLLQLDEKRLSLQEGCARFKSTEQPILAVAGVAKPYSFFESLSGLGIAVAKTLELPNHHPRPMQLIQDWIKKERILDHCVVLTTEKDAVKLAWQGPEVREDQTVIEWWALQLELSVEPSPLEFLDGCKIT